MRFLMLAVLAVGLMSCTSENVVTEGGRKLSNQNRGAGKAIIAQVDRAEAVPGVPEEARKHIAPIRPMATDVVDNSQTQLDNWGEPKNPEAYSAAASASSRKQATEEHKSSPYWPVAIGVGSTILGLVLRSTGLGGIPFLGPILERVAPRLAHGAGKADALNVGLQEVLTGVRAELDKRLPELREAALAKGVPASIVDKIPSGQVIIDQATKVLTRRGLIKENDQILERARKDAVGLLDVTKLSAAAQPPTAPPPGSQPPAAPPRAA